MCGLFHVFLSKLKKRIYCQTLCTRMAHPCGSSHVFSSNLILRIYYHTLCTWIAYHACVDHFMCFQVNWKREYIATLCALEWLLTLVGLLMYFQAIWYWESITTLCALKKNLFLNLCTWMACQMCGSFHVFSTDRILRIYYHICALELLIMHVWTISCVFK